MPTITIHNLSAETHRALQAQAKAAGRSTEAEVRHILDRAGASTAGTTGWVRYIAGVNPRRMRRG